MEYIKRNTVVIIIAFIALILLTIGVTSAFFNYTRTGSANTISVGRIYFVSREEETFTLSNLKPIDVSNGIPDDNTKVGIYELEIEGDTDYNGGVEYLVSVVDANISTAGKTIPISIDVNVNNLGDENKNYFVSRESKNATIYKILSGGAILSNQPILVGYIKPNTTKGTIEGVNGSITIKAYIDKNKIAITDTYDGSESYSMGTETNWVDGRTVITTSEWNALVNSSASFKIRVEANEDIWVKQPLDDIVRVRNLNTATMQPIMDNESSQFVSASTGIDFGEASSDNNGKGAYMMAGTESDDYPIVYYRGAVTDNNVIFGGFCWKMVRTTDTGGVKLIYNGVPVETTVPGESNPINTCNNTGTDSQITLDVNGTDTNLFKYNDYTNSLAYSGYMYGTVYAHATSGWTNGALFGSKAVWNGSSYSLVDATVSTPNATHHYSCNSTNSSATCTDLRYVIYTINDAIYYITLQNGDDVDDVISKMRTNTTSSNAKVKIDEWYADNLINYESEIEDTIWCNDRSQNREYMDDGWKSTGNITKTYEYATRIRVANIFKPSLECINKNDRFTVNNAYGNKKLDNPVGMLTADELMYAGSKYNEAVETYLKSGNAYLVISPRSFNRYGSYQFGLYANGSIGSNLATYSLGLRPAISLKIGAQVVSGTGTSTNPYVIE